METRCLAIFEDEHVHDLYPLSLTQAAFDLRLGATTLGERLCRYYPELPAVFLCRSGLADAVRERRTERTVNPQMDADTLFLNARAYPACDLARQVPVDGDECVFLNSGRLVAARLSSERVRSLGKIPNMESLSGLPSREIDVRWMDYLWDLVQINGEAISDDFRLLGRADECHARVFGGTHILNPAHFFADTGSEILPGSVLDARDGPIMLGRNVKVLPHSYIQGPCAIADDTIIKASARIYGPVSIGPNCKVGGEVARSIILGNTNKNHDGFLGDSYLGEWVNLGADTNTSNLKNTLSPVRLTIRERTVETDLLFVGTLCGDHTRVGIDTMLNTGSVIGPACNIYGGGFPPKAIPSFCWGGADGFQQYDLVKFFTVASRVLGRRDRTLGSGEKALLERVHKECKHERDAFIRAHSR